VELGRDKYNSVHEFIFIYLVDKTRGLDLVVTNIILSQRIGINKLVDLVVTNIILSQRIGINKLVDYSHNLGRDKSYSV